MKKLFGAFAAAAMMMAAQVASAATTFNFSFSGVADSGGAFSASGLLFANDGEAVDGGTVFTVTGAQGVLTLGDNSTRQITGVGTLTDSQTGQATINAIANEPGIGDYLVQIAFTFADPDEVALFTLSNMGYVASAFIAGREESASNVDFDVAAVPEPATWAMMLLGFVGIAAALRRRRVSVAFAA